MLPLWHPGQQKVSQEFAVSGGLEVFSRYRAPVAAPPYFVLVDTANCRTFMEFGRSGKFLRQKIYFAGAFTAAFVGFPTFYCDRIAQPNQRNKENCVKKKLLLPNANAPETPSFSVSGANTKPVGASA